MITDPFLELNADYPQYLWYPAALANASHSAEYLANKLNTYILNGGKDVKDLIEKLVVEGLGIVDATKEELQRLYDVPLLSVYTFADMISRRAQIGWSTHGHSAVDVNIYAYPPDGAEALYGNHENIEIGRFLQNYLDVDVEPITKELRDSVKLFANGGPEQRSWMGRIPSEEELTNMFRQHEKHRFI